MLEILVFCESAADFRTATELADRVCVEQGPEWVADYIKHLRLWRGIESGSDFTAWASVKELAKKFHLPRYLGHPGKSTDYAQTHKALLLALTQENVAAVILIRDGDSQTTKRRQGMEEARRDLPKPLAVIIGIADSKREAWVLNGFEPRNQQEQQKLAVLCDELSFDPRLHAHQLRTVSQEGAASRHVKKVLENLSNGEYERERQCWRETPLASLCERGQNTGLTHYLEELEERLIPLYTGRD